MQSYGQFCPVAKAAEILGERWTPLIIRELLCHPQSFNELRNGVALISPTLLSNRLKTLEHRGIVRRDCTGKGVVYCMTVAGEELRTVITEMGVWGQRWARSNLTWDDLDPTLLMWDIHRRLDTGHFPAGGAFYISLTLPIATAVVLRYRCGSHAMHHQRGGHQQTGAHPDRLIAGLVVHQHGVENRCHADWPEPASQKGYRQVAPKPDGRT